MHGIDRAYIPQRTCARAGIANRKGHWRCPACGTLERIFTTKGGDGGGAYSVAFGRASNTRTQVKSSRAMAHRSEHDGRDEHGATVQAEEEGAAPSGGGAEEQVAALAAAMARLPTPSAAPTGGGERGGAAAEEPPPTLPPPTSPSTTAVGSSNDGGASAVPNSTGGGSGVEVREVG